MSALDPDSLTCGNEQKWCLTSQNNNAVIRSAPRVYAASRGLAAAQACGGGGGELGRAFANAYDVYRMAAEVMLRQGLRATGGDGSYVAVEDAVSAPFASRIDGFSKVRFKRMRQSGPTRIAVFRPHPPGEDR